MSDDVHKVGCWAADAAASRSLVDELFDRWANPWKYPDANAMPVFVLFSTHARVDAWLQSIFQHDDDEEDMR